MSVEISNSDARASRFAECESATDGEYFLARDVGDSLPQEPEGKKNQQSHILNIAVKVQIPW